MVVCSYDLHGIHTTADWATPWTAYFPVLQPRKRAGLSQAGRKMKRCGRMPARKQLLVTFMGGFVFGLAISFSIYYGKREMGCACHYGSGNDYCCHEDTLQEFCPSRCVCGGKVKPFSRDYRCRDKTYVLHGHAESAYVFFRIMTIVGLIGTLVTSCTFCCCPPIRKPVTSMQMQPQQPASVHAPAYGVQAPVQAQPYIVTGYAANESEYERL